MNPFDGPDPISPQRKAEFERYQREKPAMLRSLATTFETWRHCSQKSCRRSQACTADDGRTCLGHMIRDVLSEEERAIFHMAITLRAKGASSDDAIDQAVALVERHAREDVFPGAAVSAEAPAEVEPARKYRPEPVTLAPEDEAARASRVRRLRAQPKRGLTPFPPR